MDQLGQSTARPCRSILCYLPPPLGSSLQALRIIAFVEAVVFAAVRGGGVFRQGAGSSADSWTRSLSLVPLSLFLPLREYGGCSSPGFCVFAVRAD